MWRVSALIVIVFFLGGVGGTVNSKECIPVNCTSDSASLTMDKSIIDERKDCEHRIYSESDDYVGDANTSGVLNLSCDFQKRTWKIDCHNKKRDFEACFTIERDSKIVYEDMRKNKHLLVLPVVVAAVVVGIYFYIRYRKN